MIVLNKNKINLNKVCVKSVSSHLLRDFILGVSFFSLIYSVNKSCLELLSN